MKRKWIFLIGLCIALLMGCSENASYLPDGEATLKSANKPFSKLVGVTQEFFSPMTYPFVWVGSIDFSSNDLFGSYNFAYELLDLTQKEFSNAAFFKESFYVYEGENPMEGEVLLKGTNSGVFVNGKKFVSNGIVEEASGIFEGWLGRNVHVNGYVVVFDEETGAPLELASKFQIN